MEAYHRKIILALAIAYNFCEYPVVTFAAQRFFSLLDGYRDTENTLETTHVPTVTHCAQKCIQHVDCNVYNVGPASASSLTCEIVQSTTSDISMLTQQTGWEVYSGRFNKHISSICEQTMELEFFVSFFNNYCDMESADIGKSA